MTAGMTNMLGGWNRNEDTHSQWWRSVEVDVLLVNFHTSHAFEALNLHSHHNIVHVRVAPNLGIFFKKKADLFKSKYVYGVKNISERSSVIIKTCFDLIYHLNSF